LKSAETDLEPFSILESKIDLSSVKSEEIKSLGQPETVIIMETELVEVKVFFHEGSSKKPLGILSPLSSSSITSLSLKSMRNIIEEEFVDLALPEKWSFIKISDDGEFPIRTRQESKFYVSQISARKPNGSFAIGISSGVSSTSASLPLSTSSPRRSADVSPSASSMRSSDWSTFLIDQRKSVLVIDDKEIKESEFIIGSGAMKVVHEGDWLGRHVAVVKVVECTERNLPLIRRELALYQCLRDHPNIVTLLGIVSDSKWVMEYCEWKLSDSSWAHLKQRLEWALDICNGLISLHAFNLSHGDLKPDNVLIAKDKNGAKIAKLIDFGSALRIQASTVSHRLTGGTKSFTAPELIEHPDKKHDFAACDIFALGRVILFMFSSTRGFKTAGDELTRIDEYFEKEKQPEFVKPIKEIVQSCTRLDPKKRCSLKHVTLCLKELLQKAGVAVSQSPIMKLQMSLLDKVLRLEDESERHLEILRFLKTAQYNKMTGS
jgi:hypothetical protein